MGGGVWKGRESSKETGREDGWEKARERDHTFVRFSGRVHSGMLAGSRGYGVVRSWEVWLKANEAEQSLLQGKQFSMRATAREGACVLQCRRVRHLRGV